MNVIQNLVWRLEPVSDRFTCAYLDDSIYYLFNQDVNYTSIQPGELDSCMFSELR